MTLEHRLPMALRAAYLSMHRQTDACLAMRGSTADQFVLLEGRGLVARGAHPSDGRARLVTLTREGRRLYRSLWEDTESLRKRMRAPRKMAKGAHL
ncbi:MAG: hypothetical protein ACUVYA_19755 [Planctomycetota bacterium]